MNKIGQLLQKSIHVHLRFPRLLEYSEPRQLLDCAQCLHCCAQGLVRDKEMLQDAVSPSLTHGMQPPRQRAGALGQDKHIWLCIPIRACNL